MRRYVIGASPLKRNSPLVAARLAGAVLCATHLVAVSSCASEEDGDGVVPSNSAPITDVPTGVLPGDPGVFDPPADGPSKGSGPNPNTVISANPVGCSGDGETFSGELKSCYRVVSIPALTWAQASIDCTLWSAGSGHLVSVTSSAENELVRQLVGGARIWLGATDAKVEGRWRWLSSETWFYTAFASGKPDNFERSEHCLSMQVDGTWDDLACLTELPYVCERSFAQ